MSFKSPAQRKFLFAAKDDKSKGLNPMEQKSQAKSIDLKQPQAPLKTNPFKIEKIKNPTAIPAIPALPKPARFAKIKKFFK